MMCPIAVYETSDLLQPSSRSLEALSLPLITTEGQDSSEGPVGSKLSRHQIRTGQSTRPLPFPIGGNPPDPVFRRALHESIRIGIPGLHIVREAVAIEVEEYRVIQVVSIPRPLENPIDSLDDIEVRREVIPEILVTPVVHRGGLIVPVDLPVSGPGKPAVQPLVAGSELNPSLGWSLGSTWSWEGQRLAKEENEGGRQPAKR